MQEILPPLAMRRTHDDGKVGVAGEFTAAADAVHDIGPEEMGRVGIAIDVHLEGRIHGNHAQAPNNRRMIGNLLRPQNDARHKEVHAIVDPLERRLMTPRDWWRWRPSILPSSMRSIIGIVNHQVIEPGKAECTDSCPGQPGPRRHTAPMPTCTGRNPSGMRRACISSKRKRITCSAIRWLMSSGCSAWIDVIRFIAFDNADDLFGVDHGVRPPELGHRDRAWEKGCDGAASSHGNDVGHLPKAR